MRYAVHRAAFWWLYLAALAACLFLLSSAANAAYCVRAFASGTQADPYAMCSVTEGAITARYDFGSGWEPWGDFGPTPYCWGSAVACEVRVEIPDAPPPDPVASAASGVALTEETFEGWARAVAACMCVLVWSVGFSHGRAA